MLPKTLQGATDSELEPIICHELVHLRRYDALVSLAQLLVQAIWWFHPLVWWANRQIVSVREQCCDEETVTALQCPPEQYAQQLLDVIKQKRGPVALEPTLAMASASVTQQRLEHLMLHSHSFCERTPRWNYLLALVVAMVCLPNASRQIAWADGESDVQEMRLAKSWGAEFDAECIGQPVIADGRVYVSMINRQPAGNDRPAGSLICLYQETGELLWRYESAVRPRLVVGRLPRRVAGQPLVQAGRIYYVTPAAEVVCLDASTGGHGEAPAVIWNIDLMREADVVPYGLLASRPVLAGNVLLLTANVHVEGKPASSENFIAIDRKMGVVRCKDRYAGDSHDLSWSAPMVATIGGLKQAIFPGGDGWLYGYALSDIERGQAEPIWRFDCNPKSADPSMTDGVRRCNYITTPQVNGDYVIVASGFASTQDVSSGCLWCIDATKRGDLSSALIVERSETREERQQRLERIEAWLASSIDYWQNQVRTQSSRVKQLSQRTLGFEAGAKLPLEFELTDWSETLKKFAGLQVSLGKLNTTRIVDSETIEQLRELDPEVIRAEKTLRACETQLRDFPRGGTGPQEKNRDTYARLRSDLEQAERELHRVRRQVRLQRLTVGEAIERFEDASARLKAESPLEMPPLKDEGFDFVDLQFAMQERELGLEILSRLKRRVDMIQTEARMEDGLRMNGVATNMNSGVVWKVGTRNGDTKNESIIAGAIAPPTIMDGVVVLADAAGKVHGFRASDGSRLWRCDLGSPVFSQPFQRDEHVRVASQSGKLLTLSVRTGQQIEGSQLPNPVFTVMAAGGRSLFASGAAHLTLVRDPNENVSDQQPE